MRDKITNAISVTIGIILIVLLVYAIFRVLDGGWSAYKALGDNVQIAIAVGLLSLAGTLFSIYYTKLKERELQVEAGHNSKKQKIYNSFLVDAVNIMASPTDNDDEKWLRIRKKFISNSLLWSSSDVLSVYHNFRLHAQNAEDSGETSVDFARLILAFRKDLGLKNKNVDEQTILEIMYDKHTLEAWDIDFGSLKKIKK